MSSVVVTTGDLLVADDDEAIRILLADALDGVGCTVIVAERGTPRSSWRALPARRGAPRHRDARLSAYELCPLLRDDSGSIAIVRSRGCDGGHRQNSPALLVRMTSSVKPFELNELMARVRRLLERSRRPPELEPDGARGRSVTLLAQGFGQEQVGRSRDQQ